MFIVLCKSCPWLIQIFCLGIRCNKESQMPSRKAFSSLIKVRLIPIEEDFSPSFIGLEMRSILMQESSWEEFCSSVKVSLLWHLRISIDPNFQEILRFMHLKIPIYLSHFDLYVIAWISQPFICIYIQYERMYIINQLKIMLLTSFHGELNMSFWPGLVKHQRQSWYELK